MFFDGWDSIIRVILAGVLAYVGLVVVLRISGNRTLSKMNSFDLVTVALAQCRLRARAFVLEFLAEEIVHCCPNDGDCGQLADPVPGWRHRGRQDVGSELQLQRECQVACEGQADRMKLPPCPDST